ncbi:MAG TPA: YfhO family protein [Tepidisphaeraceae bacterium]|nr:YfhO family protein [Tepidisphaeraceae bacterium]
MTSVKFKSFCVCLLMCIAVSMTYFPIVGKDIAPNVETALKGTDYLLLHSRRIRYAQEALFGPGHYLPGWYTRELGGTPFWSNLQDFPLIPNRLPLLLMNPDHAFAWGVQMAALLAAIFTFLYCRSINLGLVGASVAGWTFACSGFFASRVFAGHLPLLEPFCALPLLLWLIEVNLRTTDGSRTAPLKLLAFALTTCAIALAGHPQIPLYSFFIAAIYLLWRDRNRKGLILLAAAILGIGLASFVLYPMFLLAGRSTRVLALDLPANDLAFPYGRLISFILPWFQGTPKNILYANRAYYWDTVCYVGWFPILACIFIAVRAAILKKRPTSLGLFFALAGILALAFALPPWHDLMQQIPGTILRSPARLIYITTFTLALAAGGAVDIALTYAIGRRLVFVVVGVALFAHAMDLGYAHDRAFVVVRPVNSDPDGHNPTISQKEIGISRVAIDNLWSVPFNGELDDIGFFDSIILAKPYVALMEVGGAKAGWNTQIMEGSIAPLRAMQFFAVSRVLTVDDRPDLILRTQGSDINLYDVPSPAHRIEFFNDQEVIYVNERRIHEMLKDPVINPSNLLLLQPAARYALTAGNSDLSMPLSVEYRRPDSDHIECSITTPQAGFVRIIESWDPGWSATVDGAETEVFAAMDTFLAVPVSTGKHEIKLTYHTPGAYAGLGMSIVSMILLLSLVIRSRET